MMALVIFGFMWLNKPSEEQIRAQQAEQEQAERARAEQQRREAEEANTLHPFTAAEIAKINSQIADAATTDESGARRYDNGVVSLTANSDTTISGTVKVQGKSIDVADIIANRTDSLYGRAIAKEAEVTLRKSLTEAQQNGPMGRYLTGNDTVVPLRNELLQLGISTHGGAITTATLSNYDSEMGGKHAVAPLTGDNGTYNFTLKSATNQFNTGDLYFRPHVMSDSVVEMRLEFDADTYWGLRYTLKPESYVVHIEVVQNNMQSILGNAMASIDMSWSQRMVRNEVGRTFEERNSAVYYKYIGDKPDYLSEMESDSEDLNERVKWVAFKNQFFSAVMIPTTSFSTAKVKSEVLKDDARYLKQMQMDAKLDYTADSAVPVAFDLYIGPNLYPLLSSLDDTLSPDESLELTRLIPLGWSLFRWINTLIIIPVFTFLGSFITNSGIIILLLTIFIKIILFPFTYKSYMSQAKMRLLAPEIKEINDKYPGKENAMKRQQETMALYSRAGASPFSGCLPMMLQMPVLIAMFTFFPSCIELRGESFLWAHDLSAPDYIFALPFRIPWYGDHVSLFCLLMTVTNIIYTRINMQNQPSQASMPGMKWMMYLMPVMFLFFFNDYASGLSYYYLLSLLLTIIQTWVFRRCVNEEKLRARMAANAAKPKKKSGFMARLEEAQRQQQAMLREQQRRKGGSGRR